MKSITLSTPDGGARDARPAWLADGNNVLFQRSAKDDSAYISGLYMTINSENDIMKIVVRILVKNILVSV